MTFRGELWQGDQLVRLTGTEQQLMKIFAGSVNEPVSRAQLVTELGRDDSQAQDRAIDVQITRLRRKWKPTRKNRATFKPCAVRAICWLTIR